MNAPSMLSRVPPRTGFEPAALARAVQIAAEAETPWPIDLALGLSSDDGIHEPRWNEVLGPTQARGAPNGLVLHQGETVARWGEPDRVDMTFSVTKSFLALLTGLALGDGLITSLDDRVADYSSDDGFSSEHNREITWRHLLEQTSEWQGTLWNKPDQVDHFRRIGQAQSNNRTLDHGRTPDHGAAHPGRQKGELRELHRPGTFWEYNDVRVNRLSLSLLQLFQRGLPEVLRERIMVPIGASSSWAWHPYRNSAVDIGGRTIMSVPGGGHWGGGLFISSEDLARVGRLVQLGGTWEGRQVLPAGWAAQLRTPSAPNPTYGLMWWLNTNRQYLVDAPDTSYFMVGAGSNIVWLDDRLDLVVVMRWIDSTKLGAIVRAFSRAMT